MKAAGFDPNSYGTFYLVTRMDTVWTIQIRAGRWTGEEASKCLTSGGASGRSLFLSKFITQIAHVETHHQASHFGGHLSKLLASAG
jgi:hypothetical protein